MQRDRGKQANRDRSREKEERCGLDPAREICVTLCIDFQGPKLLGLDIPGKIVTRVETTIPS